MSGHAITGAVIFAKSMSSVARFYQAILGATVIHSGEDHIVLAAGPSQLVVHSIPKHIADGIIIQCPPELREDYPIKLFFLVSSLSTARKTALSLGGGLAPREKEWSSAGFRACDGWDPEGNVVQFREDAN